MTELGSPDEVTTPKAAPSTVAGTGASSNAKKAKKRGGGPRTAAGSFETACGPPQDERAPKKRGGGPKTARGRAVVRLNPLKHGVLSQTPVLPLVEEAADWERLRNGVFEYFEVTGALEEALGDRIAALMWRMYRVVRFESASIDRYLRDVPRDWKLSRKLAKLPTPSKVTREAVEEMDRMLMERLLPGEETLEKVMRYETKLHRFLLQTLHQFLVLKGLRTQGPGRHWGNPDLDPPGLPDSEQRHPRLPARTRSREQRAEEQGNRGAGEQGSRGAVEQGNVEDRAGEDGRLSGGRAARDRG